MLSLVGSNRRATSQRSILGGRTVKALSAADTSVELRAAWAHEFNPLASVRMRFVGDTAGNDFELTSPVRIDDTAIVGATVAGQVFRHLRFLTSVDGNVGGALKLWTASFGVRAEW